MGLNPVSNSSHEVICVANQNHFVVFLLIMMHHRRRRSNQLAWHKHTHRMCNNVQHKTAFMCKMAYQQKKKSRAFNCRDTVVNLSNQTGCSIQLVERSSLCEASVISRPCGKITAGTKNQCQPKSELQSISRLLPSGRLARLT